MKSHVRENIAKQIFANSYREIKRSETESDIEFNDFISDVIKEQAPNITFRNWHVVKVTPTTTKLWSATATHDRTYKKVEVSDPDMMGCIRKAIALLENGDEK